VACKSPVFFSQAISLLSVRFLAEVGWVLETFPAVAVVFLQEWFLMRRDDIVSLPFFPGGRLTFD